MGLQHGNFLHKVWERHDRAAATRVSQHSGTLHNMGSQHGGVLHDVCGRHDDALTTWVHNMEASSTNIYEQHGRTTSTLICSMAENNGGFGLVVLHPGLQERLEIDFPKVVYCVPSFSMGASTSNTENIL